MRGGTSVDAALVAEDLDAYLLRPPSATREDLGYAVLIDGGGPSPLDRFASRLRLDENPQSQINSIREWFRNRGRPAFTWKLGTHSRPADLERRLRAHGAHHDEAEPKHTAMVLDTEPPGADGLEVRMVESFEDFAAAAEIMFVGFGGSFTADEVAAMRAALPGRFNEYRTDGASRRYLAFADGKPIAMGSARMTSTSVMALVGGATLPEARGRGAYRALVYARWRDAIDAGAQGLVTQASEMSRPILERLGFKPVGPVLELIDKSTGI
jgi:hypothetical protein